MGARRVVVLDGTFDGWRDWARALLRDGVAAEDVEFVDVLRSAPGGEGGLFGATPEPVAAPSAPPFGVPKAFARRAPTAACFRGADVWAVLYRLVARIASGERDVLDDPLDPDVVRFQRMEKDVRRDAHKMHAFVRFRRIENEAARNGERFVAWYRPSHLIVEREASFFRNRFPSMDWSILTPDASCHWDGAEVRITPGVDRDAAPDGDELEELWCAYYASIFNPARVMLSAMKAEMPAKFWDTMPETAQIPDLLAAVPARLEEMARSSRRLAESAAPFVPAGASLQELRSALPDCEGCELHRLGGRPLLGEGPADASVAIVGEQPGDMEERAGRPFVGPAGEVLDEALAAAGLPRERVYLTNAVKHFRHEVRVEPEGRGKRRIHKRPSVQHASRCQPWLDAEMERVQPSALVLLGVSAGRSVFGPTHRSPAPGDAPQPRSSRYARATWSTFHPAAILRARDAAAAERMRGHLVATLQATTEAVSEPGREHA
ncbi:MAG: UdgX family uracil-DNA binding protein [Planctomycetota bacterium]